MINREEVLEFAREFQLEPNVVEKDYALGWLLAHPASQRIGRLVRFSGEFAWQHHR